MMSIVPKLFNDSYYSLGVAEKKAVHQTVFWVVGESFQWVTRDLPKSARCWKKVWFPANSK